MKKYYDLLESGSNSILFFWIGLSVLIVSVIVWLYFMIAGKSREYKVPIGILIIFSFLCTMIVWISSASSYLDAKKILKKATFTEVSGVVENFDPMPYEGHKNESFSVKGIRFEYSDFEIGFGFNQSKSHGGPIDEGKYVRIQYYKGRILRLWVKNK